MAILSILVAAAAGFGAGAAWYMLFAGPWMKAVGRTREEIEANRSPLPFVIGAVAALLTAIMLRHILVSAGVTGAVEALVAGLGTGAMLAAPWIVLNHAFGGRPQALWWIDGGHVVAAHGLMGLMLGVFI